MMYEKQRVGQILHILIDYLREAFKLKNVPKSGKSPKGGEGSAPEIKKSTIQNVDFLI